MMKKILIGLMAMMTVVLFAQSAQKPNKVRLMCKNRSIVPQF